MEETDDRMDRVQRPSVTVPPRISRLPKRRLRIDNVLATQPEAGPVIPDGGYGWVIFVASFYVKNIISGLTITYGLLLMFSTIETGTTNSGIYHLWSNRFTFTPLLFFTTQSLSDPLCHLVIKTSKWPRFVALVGVCLVCASILMLWLSVVDGFARTTLCIISGIFAGLGSTLISTQVDTSISQYFRLKLPAVQAALRLAECIGIIYTALVMGKYLSIYGIGHSIIWYHLIVLTSGLIILVLRKPDYLKGQQVYRILGPGQNEEEEDIFSKNRLTELQSPHTSLSLTTETATTTTVTIENQEENTQNQAVNSKNNPLNWETFDDDDLESSTSNKNHNNNEIKSTKKTDEEEEQEDELPAPRELFTEGQINHNVTYSFENVDHNSITASPSDEMSNIFLPISKGGSISYSYLRSLSFYNNCLLQFSITSGIFVFFTIFPSYLYYSVGFLHKESISHIVAVIFLATLAEACFIGCWKFAKTRRTLPIAVLLWFCAIGNFLISDWKKETLLIVGAILVTTSLCALQFLAKSVITNTGKNRIEYCALRIICALCFILFFVINPTYDNCFRLVGLLQFSSGSINFCSYVYDKISRVY